MRTTVVKQGATSRLSIAFDGHVLNQDVTAAQVAVWNKGRQAIWPAQVLEAVVIRTIPQTPILEATIRKTGRGVSSLAINESSLSKGEVIVSWRILEKYDGGVIQIVYAGGPDIKIACSGVLEGQSQIEDMGRKRKPFDRTLKWGFLVAALMQAFLMYIQLKRHSGTRLRIRGFAFVLDAILLTVCICSFALLLFFSASDPPFGF